MWIRCDIKYPFLSQVVRCFHVCLDCPDGWYGENCPFECQCARKQQCARDTGACTCLPGWKDELCTEREDHEMSLSSTDFVLFGW